jgi:hypothetical protein
MDIQPTTPSLNPQPDNSGPAAPPEPMAPAQPLAPSPSPMPAHDPTPSLSSVPVDSSSLSKPSSKAGRLSLMLSLIAVGVFITLIFLPGLVSSETMLYVWFAIIAGLGTTSFVLGLKALRSQEKVQPLTLAGFILAIIICFNCLIGGAYYIKFRMLLNDFTSAFGSSDSSDFDFDSSSFDSLDTGDSGSTDFDFSTDFSTELE